MKGKAWIATMTEGEYSDTTVYLLGVFGTREEAEAAIDARIARRSADTGWHKITPVFDWQRTDVESTREPDDREPYKGIWVYAAATLIETGAPIEVDIR